MLNVLSIDWDYFIDATFQQRYLLFPDVQREDFPDETIRLIWAGRYAQQEELEKIKIDPLVYKVVKTIKHIPKIIVGESHKFAYLFIKTVLKEEGEERLNLLNVDFHHDCYATGLDGEDNLTCGNWLRKLMEEEKGSYVWLGRSDSDKKQKPKSLKFISNYNSANIEKTKWDMVYICRSDMWSPPHLDAEFIKVFMPLTEGKNRLYGGLNSVEDFVREDRYISLLGMIQKRK